MTVVAAYRRLLENGPLVRLLAGEFVSSVGDWLYLVALLVVVYARTSSPVLLGVVGAARVLPYVLLSVPAGIVADRCDRRLVLLATDVARGAIMLALAALVAADGPLAGIVVLAIAAACFSTFFGPTIGAYLPSLVRDEAQLGPANSAWATLDNLAFVLGPAIGGVLIAASGLALAFLLNAASFGVIGIVLWRLPSSDGVRPATGSEPGAAPAPEPDAAPAPGAALEPGAAPAPATGADSAPASSPAAGEPAHESRVFSLAPIAGLLGIDVVAGFAFGGLGVLTVVLATDVLRAGDAATGYLNAAIGIGGILGALASGTLVLRRRLGPPLLAGAIVLGAGLGALGLVHDLGAALAAMTVAAAGSMLLEVVSTTIFQRAVPDAYRGRARGVMETVTMVAYSAGSFAAPVIAGALGVTPLLAGSGIAIVVATVGGLALIGGAATAPATGRDPAAGMLASLPIFAGLPAARLEEAMRRAAPVPVAPRQVVIREGDPADRFYVIARGTFRVTQRIATTSSEALLREMGPGEVFGEIGLLEGVARTASVTALDPGLLLALDGPDFLELVGSGPGLTSRLLDLHRGATSARG